MIWTFLKNLFSGPEERTMLADTPAGKAVLVGTAKAGDQPLSSPIEGKACVAFYYRSTWRAPARGSAITRLVEEAQVYAPFLLELEDDDLPVVPPDGARFGHDDHERLRNAALPGFEATEQLVKPGDRVRLHGKLHTGDDPRFDITKVEILETAPEPQPRPRTRGKKTRPAPKRRGGR